MLPCFIAHIVLGRGPELRGEIKGTEVGLKLNDVSLNTLYILAEVPQRGEELRVLRVPQN